MRWFWRRAVTATCFSSRPTPKVAMSRPSWRAYKKGAALRQSLLHADPSDVHSGQRRAPVQADADVGVASQRRPRLGAKRKKGDKRRRQGHSGSRTRLLSRTQISELWQPGAARHFFPRRQGSLRRRPWGRHRAAWAFIWILRDSIKRLGEDKIRERYGNLFDMYEKITGENAYKVPDAHLPGGALRDGRTVGGLQSDEQHSRPVRDRRSELLRSRRQPSWCQRAHARTGRRLLRLALHHRQLLRLGQIGPSHPRATRNSRRPKPR